MSDVQYLRGMSPLEKRPDSGLNAAVAAVLRGRKAEERLTNQELAERAGIPVVSVQRYLDAKRPIPVSVLLALAEAMGTTPAHVVDAAAERLGEPDPTLVERARAGLEDSDPPTRQDKLDQPVTRGRKRS